MPSAIEYSPVKEVPTRAAMDSYGTESSPTIRAGCYYNKNITHYIVSYKSDLPLQFIHVTQVDHFQLDQAHQVADALIQNSLPLEHVALGLISCFS